MMIQDHSDIILETLRNANRFKETVFIHKLSGSIADCESRLMPVLRDMDTLHETGIRQIVIHGAGNAISDEMKKAGLVPKFIDGRRVTDEHTMRIVYDVLRRISHSILLSARRQGIGRRFIDFGPFMNRIATAHRTDPNLGFVGTLCAMNVSFLHEALKCNLIPIIPSFAFDIDGQPCNVNADDMASGIAAVMKAEKLIYMSDIPGVMDGNGNLIETLDQNETERLIGTGIISGGMIPKVRSIFRTLNQGVKCVHLIDGTKPDSLLKEIMTDTGNGTMFIP